MIPIRRFRRRAAAATALCLALAAGVAFAGGGQLDSPLNQATSAPPQLTITLKPLGEVGKAGGRLDLGVLYHVPPGTHLTTTFLGQKFTSDPPAVFGKAVFPRPVRDEIPFFRGEVLAQVPVSLPERPGPFRIDLQAEYQLCREGDVSLCYPPEEATATLSLEVAAADAATAGGTGSVDAGSAALADAAAAGGLEGRLAKALLGGSWLAFLMVFLGGVLASFTPCVYPMIPITISYIGGNARGKPLKGFVLSLWYVLGIAIVYSALGVLAAATGAAFGQATQTPLFAAVVAVIIGAMALSMAGLFEIQLPSGLATRVGGGRTGFLGPLLMGAAMGLVAAPCVGPILIVVLAWVATTGSLFLGFWLLFTFALGMGMLFLALGTFSGLLTALPGAGGWMETVKHGFAVVLYALALWFLRLYLPGWLLSGVFGLALVLSVSAWGAWRQLPPEAGARAGIDLGVLRFLWLLGALLAVLGGLRGLTPGLLPHAPAAAVETAAAEPDWLFDRDAAFARAAQERKPVMMDFWAEWCAACRELDRKTYDRPEILALARDFVPLKLDLTARTDANAALQSEYGVVGMPTVIFFDPDGAELERFSGFKDADDLAAIMRRILARGR